MEDNNIFNCNEDIELSEAEKVISENNFITSDEYRQRFSGAEWFDFAKTLRILVIGLGGIGSHTALNIAKLGCNLGISDFDIVDSSNMSGQLHFTNNIGRQKTESTVNVINEFTNHNTSSKIDVYNEDILSESLDERMSILSRYDIIVLALDSIDVRKSFFDTIMYMARNTSIKPFLIDGRLTAELVQVFTCNTSEDKSVYNYRDSLFDKSEAMETTCSFKQTFYLASMMGSIITNQIVNYCINSVSEFVVPQPSFIEYDSRIMNFNIKY